MSLAPGSSPSVGREGGRTEGRGWRALADGGPSQHWEPGTASLLLLKKM